MFDDLQNRPGQAKLTNFYPAPISNGAGFGGGGAPAQAFNLRQGAAFARQQFEQTPEDRLHDAPPAASSKEAQTKAESNRDTAEAKRVATGDAAAGAARPQLANPPAATAKTADARGPAAPPRPGEADKGDAVVPPNQNRAEHSNVRIKKDSDAAPLAKEPSDEPKPNQAEKPRGRFQQFSPAAGNIEARPIKPGTAVRIPVTRHDEFVPHRGGFGSRSNARSVEGEAATAPQPTAPSADGATLRESPADKKNDARRKGGSAEKAEAEGDDSDDDLSAGERETGAADAAIQAGQKNKFVEQSVRIVFVIELLPGPSAEAAAKSQTEAGKAIAAPAEADSKPTGK